MKRIYLALLFSFYALPNYGSEAIETAQFAHVLNKAVALGRKYEPSKVLIVFDIDNTLLKTNQDLGGEPFFDWQASLLPEKGKAPNKNRLRLACDFDDLLKLERLALGLSRMSITEETVDSVITELKRHQFPIIALTSRGFDDATYTHRELNRNHIHLEDKAPDFSDTISWPHPPNVTDEERAKYKLFNQAAYQGGVYFTEGMHKGAMLKELISQASSKPKAIVFVDNKEKHTSRVYEIIQAMGIDVTTIRYSVMDKEIEAFDKSSLRKAKSVSDFRKLHEALQSVYGYPKLCH